MNFALPEEITIKSVQALKDNLCELLDESKNKAIAIDASQLQRIDSLGYQLLLAFHQAATVGERTIEWSEPSGALLECNRLLGNGDTLFTNQPAAI